MPPIPKQAAPQPKQLAAFPEPAKGPPKPKVLSNAKAPQKRTPKDQRPAEPERPTIYPVVEVRIYSNPPSDAVEHPIVRPLMDLLTGVGLQMPADLAVRVAKLLSEQNMGYQGPMTRSVMKALLGWESESEYTARRVAEEKAKGNAVEPESCKFESKGEGKTTRTVDWTLVDANGEKVMCWNNRRNRSLDEGTYAKYAQDILNKDWEFNLETFIVSTTGNVVSGQHRGVAFMLACQMWERKDDKGKHWRSLWPKEPTIDMLVAFGFTENARTLRTLDNVRPRKLEDVFYTSEFFNGRSNAEKKELSRMLDVATDLLFKRTRAGDDSYTHYQTHSTSIDFVERHKKLLQCVNYLFEANSTDGRAIAALKGPTAGECSALMYMMGSSASDGDLYHKPMIAADRKERGLNWDRWDRACEFFTLLAGKSGLMKPITDAFGDAVDKLKGEGGTKDEYFAILAKAWGAFLTDEGITRENIALTYDQEKDADGKVIGNKLQDWPVFGGIDLGPLRKKDGKDVDNAAKQPTVSPEQVRRENAAKLADELNKRRAATKNGTPAAPVPAKPPAPAFRPPTPAGPKQLAAFPGQPAENTGDKQLRLFREIEKENPDKLLVLKLGTGYRAWDSHCTKVCELLGCDPIVQDGQLDKVNISHNDWEEASDLLTSKGQVIGIVEPSADGGMVHTQTLRPSAAAPKPAAPPTPKPAQPNMKPVPK